jgi:hypothetical protein
MVELEEVLRGGMELLTDMELHDVIVVFEGTFA